MADRTLICEIVTPEKVLYTNECRMVVVPTTQGEIGILPMHAPIVSTLDQGEVRVMYGLDGRSVEWFAISGGYVQVHEDKVIVLADNAEIASRLDLNRLAESIERNRALLAELPKEEGEARDRCERDLNWCQVQLKVAEKRA